MNFDFLRHEFNEWIDEVIDRENLYCDDLCYDVGLENEQIIIFDKIKDFFKMIIKKKRQENEYD